MKTQLYLVVGMCVPSAGEGGAFLSGFWSGNLLLWQLITRTRAHTHRVVAQFEKVQASFHILLPPQPVGLLI